MADRNLALKILIDARDSTAAVFSKLKTSLTGIAGLAAGLFSGALFAKSVDDAEKLNTQMRKLEATIQATGGAAGLTASEIDDMARRLDEATLGSASGFRDAANILLTFKSISKDTFETTLTLAQDLADAGFGNLSSNAVQLGKALENPVKGLTALSKSGVSFSDSQKELIKQLVETGDLAKAQGIILEAVAGQVGGVAKAMGGGLAGASDLVTKRFMDLREIIGQTVVPALTVFNTLLADGAKYFTDWLKSSDDAGKAAGTLGTVATGLATALAGIGFAIDRLVRGTGALGAKFAALANFDTAALDAIDEAFSADNAAALEKYNALLASLKSPPKIEIKTEIDTGDIDGSLTAVNESVQVITNQFKIWEKASTKTIDGIAEGLKKLSDGELEQMKATLATAFDSGIEKSEELANALKAISAEEVTRAWKTLGVTSEQSLKQAADAAKRAYLTIRDSGQASSNDLGKAWNAYMKQVQSAASAVDAVSDAEQRRKNNLQTLDSTGTTAEEKNEAKKQQLAQETAEFQRLLRAGEFEQARRLSEQTEQLAFEVAQAEKQAYLDGQVLSFDATKAREDYLQTIKNTKLALEELNAAEKNKLAAETPTPDDAQTTDTGTGAIDQQKAALEALNAQKQLIAEPVALTINDNLDETSARVLNLLNLLAQVNASTLAVSNQVDQATGFNEQIAREALARGRR
jgi:hypothetical protein